MACVRLTRLCIKWVAGRQSERRDHIWEVIGWVQVRYGMAI